MPNGYGRAIVYLEFTCENAFGVAQRYQRYVFIQEIRGDMYRVKTDCYHCEKNHLEIFKILNDFGRHPDQEQYAGVLAEGNLIQNGVAQISTEQTLLRYICNTELVTIELYVDSVTDNLSAVKVIVNSGTYTNADTKTQKLIMEATVSALAQIVGAQKAELITTGGYNFSADNLTTYLATSKRLTDFAKGGLIISADVVDGKSVVSVVDGFRYGFTEQSYWTPLGERETDSLICSQCGTDCTSIGMESDGRCKNCHADSNSASGGLFGTLDLSKVWKTEWTEMGFLYSACYAFEENGECYMVIDWNGTEAISGGKGTYAVDGNSVTFSLVLDGSSSVVYTYTFDSASCTFTQTSEAGLVSSHKQGDIFTLKADDFNTVDRIKRLSQAFNGTANPDNADPSDNTSSIGNNNTSNNTGASGNSGTSSNTGLSDNTSSSGSSTIACSHSYADATCTTPKTCTKCGATTGSAAGHTWKYATCTEPATCTTCHETWGSANGHLWREATCSAPKTCQTCKSTEGSALPHNLYYTKCTTCDHTDFSQYTLTSNTFCLDSWFNLGDGSGSHYLEDGEASINIDSNGVCKVTFDKYSYTFTLVQSEVDVHGLHFKCYMNGAQVKNTEITFFFSQNRCDFFNYGDTLGFSQVALNFDM